MIVFSCTMQTFENFKSQYLKFEYKWCVGEDFRSKQHQQNTRNVF
jgi:hypothetical protein